MKRKTLAPLRAALSDVIRAVEGIDSAADISDRQSRDQALRQALVRAEHEREWIRDCPRTLADAHELTVLDAELARMSRRAAKRAPCAPSVPISDAIVRLCSGPSSA
jgi:hypothetical protein